MIRLAALVATVFCVAVPHSAGGQTASDPLRLVLGCSTRGSELTVRFTLQNVSEVPTAAVIGMIFGNDRKYEPDRLELTVRRAGAADTTLTYVDTSSGWSPDDSIPGWLSCLPALHTP